MEQVMKGNFTKLPPNDSNVVRVFLSSTFGDFIKERNRLSHETFPLLQSYCQAQGLEFQVVDMRWGVRDENISYHQTSEVCIQEICHCQRLSIGPSFLGFIGDRYGYRPFPAKIHFEEFQLFLQLGLSYHLKTTLLSKWYKLDENTMDRMYQLVPITVHYPNYISKDATLRAIDRNGWWKTFQELQKIFWKLVKVAVEEGKITTQRAHVYTQSVTEDEINHGIFQLSSPNDSCLCYTRSLTGLSSSLLDKSAKSYLDTKDDGSVDVEAQKLLKILKCKKLPEFLNSSNMKSYTIPWVPGGINEEVEEHSKYLSQLCTQVYSDIKLLIDRALKVRNNLKSKLHAEVLHHASLCISKCESYCDRRDNVMTKIKNFIRKPVSGPLIIHGKSGSGKTSIMAKATRSIQEWCDDECVIVLRFLGTSPMSSSIREVLVSICEQVCRIFNLNLPSNFHRLDTIEVIQYFRYQLLGSLVNDGDSLKQLIIMLDSIDQLSPSQGAHSMKWLPLLLPHNVQIIVSMLEEKHDCFKNLRSSFRKPSFVVPSLCF